MAGAGSAAEVAGAAGWLALRGSVCSLTHSCCAARVIKLASMRIAVTESLPRHREPVLHDRGAGTACLFSCARASSPSFF
jgi:hypothetical protein